MSRLLFDCRLQFASGFQLDAAFTAGDGVTAVFGPSGAGKSTVFALIAGLLRPQSGTIRLGERMLVDTGAGIMVPPEARQIGVVFQDHLLFPHLTVRQNLTFGRRRGARTFDFHRVVEMLEIGALLERRPDTLSGGQRQRVALGRALLRGPELLLMDEPLSAVDEGLRDRVLTYLERAVTEWNIPTLFVSHDQADVRRLAGQVVVLEAGQVIATGPTGPTLDRAMLTLMKQRPALVNLLRIEELHPAGDHREGRISGQVFQLPAGPALQPAGSVYVQFLPQDVVLAVEPLTGLSARNRLQGVVRELVTLPGRTLVAIDVGQFLWAEVTPQAVEELAIRPGQVIHCWIKSTAVALVQ